MKVEFRSIEEFGLPAAAELLTRAFADYFVRILATDALLRHMAEVDSVALADSPVVMVDGVPAGAALIARRGAAGRVAGMAFVPEMRRKGAGRAAMERMLADARARGERRMVLEVIEQNEPAVRLYESVGFLKKRRLVGFAGPAPAGSGPLPGLRESSLAAVAVAIRREDAAVDWPWQISGETIARQGPPATGWILDGASLVLANPDVPVITIRALAVEGADRREERAVRLLHAVMARHPGREWRVSALWPEELASWFTAAGLVRTDLCQWQMECALAR